MNYKKIILLLSVFTLIFTTACDDDEETVYGNWVREASFSGNGRSEAVSFTIGETFYYGLGYNKTKDRYKRFLSDFYSYKGGNNWTEVAKFPGDVRTGAVSFAVDGKGYLMGGYNSEEETYYNDVWQYTPDDTTGVWKKLADFPGETRRDATSFVVGGIAYVVGGYTEDDGAKKDCWIFNSASETFEKGEDMYSKRYGATSFVINKKAYVLSGSNDSYVSKVEVFDGESKSWIIDGARNIYLSKTTTDDISYYDEMLDLKRMYASAFVIGDRAYLMGGYYEGMLNSCWEYDPIEDLWTEMNSFPTYSMSGRYKATAFSLGGIPHYIGGTNGTSYYDQMWTLEPKEEYDDTDDVE